MRCGLIHPREFSTIRDPHGCALKDGHAGPHEFVCSEGITYNWRDSECADCDCDLEGGECCTEYWRKAGIVDSAAEIGRGDAMTQIDVEKLAREAGFLGRAAFNHAEDLMRFAALVLEHAAQTVDPNPNAEMFRDGIAEELRQMAKELKP
jgi:hypothetical protein